MSDTTTSSSSLTAVTVEPKSSFDLTTLTESQKQEVESLKKALDPKNSDSIITYGVGAQKDISDFTSQILSKVQTKDVGMVGEILSQLSVEVKKVDPTSLLANKKSFLSDLPGIGYFFDALKQFKAKYSSIESNINQITDKLDSQYEMMLRDIIMFDDLYKENLNYYHKLDLILYAGQEKLEELEAELKEKENEYGQNASQIQIEEIQNLRNYLTLLENRLHDLELTRISTIQSFPQISIIKVADQGLAGKVQSAILNTIPLWKRHITIAIGLYNQQVVVKDLKNVDDATDSLLRSNSELLKQNSVDVARSLQRGIVSIETLELVQKNLIESIDEVRDIVEEGKQQRQVAKVKIHDLETELKAKLLEVKTDRSLKN
ncbi:MAG: toxic anion resistance protein [bacterium]